MPDTPTQRDPARAVLLEAMARANCRHNLHCEANEVVPLFTRTISTWELYVDDMGPLLDAVLETQASLRTLAPMLGRIAGAAA